jgi:hypothetical protein
VVLVVSKNSLVERGHAHWCQRALVVFWRSIQVTRPGSRLLLLLLGRRRRCRVGLVQVHVVVVVDRALLAAALQGEDRHQDQGQHAAAGEGPEQHALDREAVAAIAAAAEVVVGVGAVEVIVVF